MKRLKKENAVSATVDLGVMELFHAKIARKELVETNAWIVLQLMGSVLNVFLAMALFFPQEHAGNALEMNGAMAKMIAVLELEDSSV